MQIIDKERDLAARLRPCCHLRSMASAIKSRCSLASAIARSESPHRPWLDIRMPKYPFDPHQVITLDRIVIRQRSHAHAG